MEVIDTVVVGGGQAGIAASEHLTNNGIEHVVLERHRIAERWRSERWDSLVMNGPAWHDRFPNLEFNCHPDAFPGKEDVADYMVAYAEKIGAPIRTGVEVKRVSKVKGGSSFIVETSEGQIEARHIIAATGPFQKPIIPPMVPTDASVFQMHSNSYHNPEQLPEGAVLVVGAGSSGTQIAEELRKAGRKVYLSVGAHDRPPRRYRNRDFVWWLGVLNKWNADTPNPGTEHVTIAVSGAEGGKTVDFRRLAHEGLTLVGMTKGYSNGTVQFENDLVHNVNRGDANYLSVLEEADAFIAANGLDLPEEPEAKIIPPDPECMVNPILDLNLAEQGITTILWATGYALDYSWLEADTFDERGRPIHQRGVSKERGIYFLGLPWLTRRGSAFIWGAWHDAKFVADQIQIQHNYSGYHGEAEVIS